LVFYNSYNEDISVTVPTYWEGDFDKTYTLKTGERTPGTYDQIMGKAGDFDVTIKDKNGKTTTQNVFVNGNTINHYVIGPAAEENPDHHMLYYNGVTKKSADGRIIFQITNSGFENVTLYSYGSNDCADKLLLDPNDGCGKELIEFPPQNTSELLIDTYLVLDDHIQVTQDFYGFLGIWKGGGSCRLDVSEVSGTSIFFMNTSHIFVTKAA